MSKLYQKYSELKESKGDTLFLFKSGMFYLLLDEDAKKASKTLNLKLTYLNGEIVKCGFPLNSLTKYSKLLDAYNIKYEIIDNGIIGNKKDYIENKEIQSFLYRIKNLDIDKTTPLKCMDILVQLKELLNSSANM